MKDRSDKTLPTKLSDSRYEECMALAAKYLEANPFIRNRDIRAVASIGYDQAIYFFNRAILENQLVREGSGSGSRYVLPKGKAKNQ